MSHNLYIDDVELTEAIFPETVSCIKDYAFLYCESITTFYIPSTVTSIGYSAFVGTSNVQQIIVEEDNPNYDSRSDCNAIIETASNTLISGCKNTIIPESVLVIGRQAFYDQSGLQSIVVPSTVVSIEDYAFCGCGLNSIYIPSTVTSIGYSAFVGTSNVQQIIVEEDNPNYDSRSDCNAIIETASNTLISGCKNTIIPESVLVIGRQAFYDQSGLQSIVVPSTVVSIEDYAFCGCGLNSITSLAIIPPSLGNYVFAHVPCSTLVVPCGCATAYGTSTWYDNFPNIVEDCTTVSEDNENTVSIYPNPTYGAISIEAEGLQHINVYTILGQLVESRQADGEVFELDLSSHEAGIYLIRIETASGIATKRVALTK